MANKKPLSVTSAQALKFLKGRDEPTIMADIEVEGLNSANLTALVTRGLIEAEKVEIEVPTVVKRKVNAYTITEKGQNFKEEAE